MQRYRQAKSRLQAELKDQLLTRTENLDEDHSALEYARERSELLSLEAKVGPCYSVLYVLVMVEREGEMGEGEGGMFLCNIRSVDLRTKDVHIV